MKTKPPFNFVYLDWNIIVSFLNGQSLDLLHEIKHGQKMHKFLVPYTATHIDEATNKESSDDIPYRLNFISSLSQNIYFENSSLDCGLVSRHPNDVHTTLNDVWFPYNRMRKLANIFPYSFFAMIRKSLDIDPVVINNLEPESVVPALDEILLKSKYAHKLPPSMKTSPIRGVFNDAIKNSIKHFGRSQEIMGAPKSRAAGPDIKVTILYMILESLGYWSDKKSIFKKASRIADHNHCFYSLFSEITISGDKKFRKKCRVIAHECGSNTKYVSPDKAVQLLKTI